GNGETKGYARCQNPARHRPDCALQEAMNLVEAIDGFCREARPAASAHSHSIELLGNYLSARPTGALTSLLPDLLRDFLSRWYIEATASKQLPLPDAVL